MEDNQQSYFAILNMKSFKNINDSFGFEVGNKILQEIAEKITYIIKNDAVKLYRLGNDEFALRNTQKLQKNEFVWIIEKIISYIDNEIFYYKGTEFNVTIYAGISFETKQKLETADMALELAKQQNKEYIIYSTDNTLSSSQYNNIVIVQMIKKALHENNILVYFQPIVNRHGAVIKYESLIRIQNGSEIISPYYFIEISKKTKYYSHLTKKVIEKSFNTFKNRKE